MDSDSAGRIQLACRRKTTERSRLVVDMKKYRDRSPVYSRREKDREGRSRTSSRSSRDRLSGETLTRKSSHYGREDRDDRRISRHRHHRSDRDHLDDRKDHKKSHELSSEQYVSQKMSSSSDDSDVPLKSAAREARHDSQGIDTLLWDLASASSGGIMSTISDSDSEKQSKKRRSSKQRESPLDLPQTSSETVSESGGHEEGELDYEVPASVEEVIRRGRWYSGYDDEDMDSNKSRSPDEVEKGDRPSVFPESEGLSEVEDYGEEAVTREEGQEMLEEEAAAELRTPSPELPAYYPATMGCRNVENYEWLNRIEEGTYGVVYRAKDKRTDEVVALKKLKMEKEKEGFPITPLREINMLMKIKHPNIVHVREIVVGSNMDKIYIVMDYVEHDLKALMETMKQPFLQGEVKTLTIQLLRAVHHLHDNWILHRDLKTSNLLLSHKGVLKVGDFGLAREYGSPLLNYTPVVVTLWYRSPELLLGSKEYSTAIDMWSVGCIFAEFLLHKPLFRGKSEIDQLNQIFIELGSPNDETWPGYSSLPMTQKINFARQPRNNLLNRFPYLTENGFKLLNWFFTYDPKKRIIAEAALKHAYFKESPKPVDPSMSNCLKRNFCNVQLQSY